MFSSARTRLVVSVMAVAVAVGAGGFVLGAEVRSRQASAQAQAAGEREQKMLAFIVKRNPNATIRDFSDFPEHVLAVARKQGIDYRLIMAMIDKESQFRPDAVGGSGEVGLMQIMPSTGALVAKRLGVKFEPPVKRRDGRPGYETLGTLGDPRINVEFGAQYLAWQVAEFGMSPAAIRGYNRAPEHARSHWPDDRYAEDVALGFMVLAASLPE